MKLFFVDLQVGYVWRNENFYRTRRSYKTDKRILFHLQERCCVGSTNWLTNSTEQSPSWAANWFSASQEILRILCNPEVHYRIPKRPPLVSVLSQISPIHASAFIEDPINVIFPPVPKFSSGRFPSGFPTKTPLLSPMHVTCPTDHHVLLNASLHHSPVTSSLLGPNISSAPYSQTPSAYVLLWVQVAKFHTHTKQEANVHFCLS